MTPSTILVIDDNPIARKIVQAALAGEGYEVLEAADGRTALALTEAARPHLILQDLGLPDTDGFDLATRLRAVPGTAPRPIIAWAGSAGALDHGQLASLGFVDVLTKPVEPARLLQAVRAHLGHDGASQPRAGRGRRVLVVDDDPIQAKLLRTLLVHQGFDVATASDGTEALERALLAPPDAIASDTLMPRVDGFQLCLAARRHPRLAHVPIVLYSSTYVPDEAGPLAQRVGASVVVERTPSYSEVIGALLASLESDPPSIAHVPVDALRTQHLQQVARQLQHEVARSSELAERAALQAAALSVLGGLAEALATATDVRSAVGQVLAQCLDAAGIPMGALYLIDKGGELWLETQYGYASNNPADPGTGFGHVALLREIGAAGAVVAVPGEGGDAARAFLGRTGGRSALLVPLVSAGECSGIMVLVSDGKDLGQDHWVAFARTLSVHFGQALRLTRRQREAEALAAVARTLTESLDVGAVAERIVESVLALFEVRSAGFRLLRADGSLVAVAGDPSGAHAQPGHVLAPGMGISGRVVAEGKAVWCADLLTDPRFAVDEEIRPRLAASDLRAFMAVPLRVKGRTVGVLSAADRMGRVFADSEVALLQTFADQAALALENARLYQEAEQRRREAEVVAELARTINASLDVDAVLQRIVEGAQELCGSDLAQIAFRDGSGDTLSVRHCVGARTGGYGAIRFEPAQGVGGLVLVTGQPQRTDDYARDPRITKEFLADMEREGIVATLGVPIVIEGRVEGLLLVDNRRPRPFSQRDEAVLLRLADHAAIAIQNARLYQSTQQAYEELSRTQAQLVQAQKLEAIGRLAGGIAHDFNNLLTVILGRSEILLKRLGSDEGLRRHVGLIQQTGERAARLTHQLLAFSRQQVLQPRVLDLNAVVAGMEPMLRRLIGEDVELVTVPAADLGRVKADPGQVEQVILNLAVNARDAMPKGGRLILQTANGELDEAVAGRHLEARPGRYVKLEVTDTGSGMDATTQARIFEPFFTTKGPGKGTGLGLATVFGIVRQSGGHIWVYSEPEHGTTFKILLPRIDDVDVEPDARSAERDGDGGSETILLVEDDAALRELTAEMLGERGYAVLEAGSPEEALGIAARQAGPIHLLLTDVVMPQMSGRVLASRMAAARPGLQVLYMSGYTDEALGHHGVLAPGMALLQKPFSASGLAHKVRQALDGRSAPDHTAGSATTERGH